MTTNKRKFATADGRVVDEGHPEARFLVAGPDDEVDKDLVARLKEEAKADKPAPAEHAETKATEKPADKAVHKAADK